MSSVRNSQAASDTQHNVKDAALLGASLAFSKPSIKPKPQTNTYTGSSNGALVAATKAGNPSPVKRDWTGGSSRSLSSRPNASPLQYNSRSNSSNTLPVPDHFPSRESSPSNIAARLATLRYSPSRPIPRPSLGPILSERNKDERDVLPPSGSVGNVLARFEPQKPLRPLSKRSDTLESDPGFNAPRSQPIHAPTDSTPIPPTTSLVKMFEQNRPISPVQPSLAPLNIAQSSPPPIRSPKPQRVFSIPQEPKHNSMLHRTKTLSPPPLKPKPKQQIGLIPSHSTDGAKDQIMNALMREPMKSPPIRQKSVQLVRTQTSTPSPKPPPARGSRSRLTLQGTSRPMSAQSGPSMSLESFGSPDSFKSAEEYFQSGDELRDDEDRRKEKQAPPAPPTRRSQPRRIDAALPVQTTQPTIIPSQIAAPVRRSRPQSQVRAPIHPPERFSPPIRPASTTGVPPTSVFHNRYQRQSMQQITQHMTGETLSDAIMGAALASSSRNASPAPRTKSIEPLLPPRKQHHHHLPFHRSPSPPKQSPPKSGKLRTTMRKDPSSSEDEDEVDKYKKKGTRIMGIKGRKHPNKHHEGTRKRWRDQITERERKRYEGVWAANKGTFLLPSSSNLPSRGYAEYDPSLEVLNISVQEIWTRSRLPTHVLEEVWNLVDSRGVGRLSRYEFVVGLWLIDQRLKGRKLPTRVSDSVWDSAKGVGLRVRSIK